MYYLSTIFLDSIFPSLFVFIFFTNLLTLKIQNTSYKNIRKVLCISKQADHETIELNFFYCQQFEWAHMIFLETLMGLGILICTE